jgi:hypothetical protein
VESEPGKGSDFWLTVCIGKGSEEIVADVPAECSAEQELLVRFGGARVLLAEDEPTNREVARIFLEDVGLQVDLAENGLEAYLLAERNDYALILMDMQMPVLDGIEATKSIRQIENRADTPILALTANAFNEDREKCLAAGMNDFIAKPFEPDVLFAMLLKWMTAGKK